MHFPALLSISVLFFAAATLWVRKSLNLDQGHFRQWSICLARRGAKTVLAGLTLLFLGATRVLAAPPEAEAGEANLKLPDFSQVQFLGVGGRTLLMVGIVFCVFGLLFGLAIYSHLKNLPVHRSMAEISQLIWETCKTYLVQQGKFLAFL